MTSQQRWQNNAPQNIQRGANGSRYNQGERDGSQQGGLLNGNVGQLSRALGWFSLGLGLAQLAAPQRVAEWIGVSGNDDTHALLRAVGVREIASGIGILSQSKPAGWLKARVGGDVMDLALLGAALNSDQAEPERVTKAMAAVAGIAVIDLLCSQQVGAQQDTDQVGMQQNYQQFSSEQSARSFDASTARQLQKQGVHVKKSITVNRSAEELYQFWHNFENLPRFMSHLEAVQVMDGQRSHWKAKAPAGMTVEWDAEIVDDRSNESISWRSLEGADVPNTGSVRFARATGGRGTMVTVELQYAPPGGVIGSAIAWLFGEEPEQQISDDLRAFKQVIETGEVVRSDGTPWGPRFSQRPAQPLRADERPQ